MDESVSSHSIDSLIFQIRGRRVMLDADLARLYRVSTGRFNEAFKRHRRRFPVDFAFKLSATEFNLLRSRMRDADRQQPESKEEKMMLSQFATASGRRRNLKLTPWAFTEHGALMAANILRGERAIQMSVFVVRAFVRMREQVAANDSILKRLAEIDSTLLQHDAALRDVYQKLLPLLRPAPEPPKRSIGFHAGDHDA
jgi:hypothetical protein